MSTYKKYTGIIFFVVWAVILSGLCFWLVNSIEQDSANFVSAKDEIAFLNSQKVQTQNFSKEYSNYQDNLQKIEQAFIDPQNPVDLIKFLENSAAKLGMTSQTSLAQGSPQSKGASRNYIVLQFSATGKFAQSLNLAKEIESGPYLLEIQNLTIQNSEKGTSAVFNIKAFTKL